MPTVKELRKTLVSHNNKCKIKGIKKMKKSQLLKENRKRYGKHSILLRPKRTRKLPARFRD